PVIGALFWRRATGAGALAAILVGSLTVVALMIRNGLLANSPIYGGLLASLVAFVVVSLLTPRTPRETMSAWDRRVTGTAQRS
ncbi:MAG: sodium:solute symporter, partial [Rubrobacter sp.]